MNLLSRIFRRTPSLRARVVVATAIGAAIPVLIVGIVVWVGITGDRKERLDRRLDEAAGFAIPFLPRGLDEIPKTPNDQDAVITVRKNGHVQLQRHAPRITCRLRGHLRRRRSVSRTHRGDSGPRADVGRRRRHL
jgi:two-component system sensor histidine kinase PrrB